EQRRMTSARCALASYRTLGDARWRGISRRSSVIASVIETDPLTSRVRTHVRPTTLLRAGDALRRLLARAVRQRLSADAGRGILRVLRSRQVRRRGVPGRVCAAYARALRFAPRSQ